MKVKRSGKPGQVVFEVGTRDVRLLAQTDSIAIAEDDAFRERLDDRATRRTRLLDEILSRPPLAWNAGGVESGQVG